MTKLIDYTGKPLTEQDRCDLARLRQLLRTEGILPAAWQEAYERLLEREVLS
jgi:hypothetical protein